jgi:hypothetical protein
MLSARPRAAGRVRAGIAARPGRGPLLLRDRKVAAELSCDPVTLAGPGDRSPEPDIAVLDPDDAVLIYAGGVTKADPDGEQPGMRIGSICPTPRAGSDDDGVGNC